MMSPCSCTCPCIWLVRRPSEGCLFRPGRWPGEAGGVDRLPEEELGLGLVWPAVFGEGLEGFEEEGEVRAGVEMAVQSAQQEVQS